MRLPVATLLVLFAAPAGAADSFYATFIAGRDGEAPCYARTYDGKHLAAHPKQKVIHFFVTRSEAENLEPPKTFELSFGFRLRDSDDVYASEAACTAKSDGAVCSAEGDGGQFRLTPREDGLLVTVVGRLELEGGTSFSPDLMESDDREFRLYASPAEQCVYDWGDDEAPEEGDPNAPSLGRPGSGDG